MADVYTPPMVISRGGFAALMRVLLEQDDLQITDIQSESVAVGRPSANKFYRVRLTAVGEQGTAAMNVLLKVLPDATWIEAWNPRLDGPAELVALESDLLTSLPQSIVDPTLASARAREGKPAWTMASDVIADLGQGQLSTAAGSDAIRLILYRLAELHALHWDALPVLDFVYPWVTRQSEWLREAAALYAAALRGETPDTAPGRLLDAEQPNASAALNALFDHLEAEDATTLRRFLDSPEWLIERLATVPPTICHGAPTSDHMALVEDRLLLVEWEYLQVAPSSWDVWNFWSSLAEAKLSEDDALAFYLDALESIVETVDREAWMDTYRLAPVTAFVLHDLAQAVTTAPDAPPPPGLLTRAAHAAEIIRLAGLL